ncbi:MAG: M81 family metallopeptidase [Planctomycetaceae bacterium]|jgi:microcystin degradation protein MlrC
MRVGIIGLLHESNTFIARKTTLSHFERDTLLTGHHIKERFSATAHELSGFFAGLEQEAIEAVPIFAARAVPYGPVTTDTLRQLVDMMLSEVVAAGTLDGILVAPHGATVSESIRDVDGHWLERLRQHVGTSMPMIGTLDAHANLSPRMVDATNALVAYRTNPHLDQFDRGIEAAQLMAKTVRGEVRPVQHAEFPPLAINIERQMTSEPHLVPVYESLDAVRKKNGVLSSSLLLGFPYADVEEMGSSVVVVTDNDRQLARDEAHSMAEQLWQQRHDFDGQFISMDDAVQQAMALDGPVCLLDMGDNVGGGSPGDSTHLIHAIRRFDGARALACIYDPSSVQTSVAAGIGASTELEIGGKTDDQHGTPLRGLYTVQGIYDGKFTDTQTRHGGFTQYDQGHSAVVTSCEGQLTVLLTSNRTPPFSLVQLTSCDLNPESFHIIVAKGVNAPVAAYAPVCRNLIRVNSPGCTTADMKRLKFEHRRKPMFPFEDSEVQT